MTRLYFSTTLLLATACTADEPSLVQDGLSSAAEFTTVWDAAPQLYALQGNRALVSDGATALLLDPRLPEPLDLGLDATSVRGGAWLGEQVLVATPTGVFAWDGRVWSSPLTDALPGVPEWLASDGRALWVRADGGLHRLQDGDLKTITVQNMAPLGPTLLGATVSGTPVTWVSTVQAPQPGAMALADDGTLLAHIYADDVRSVGADLSGHTWVADGVSLHDLAPDGSWTTWNFDSAVAHVAANPASDALWVKTVDTVYYGTSAGLGPVSGVPDGTWVRADSLGRLQLATPDGVLQVAVSTLR